MATPDDLDARIRQLAQTALDDAGGDIPKALKGLVIQVKLDPELDEHWRVESLRKLLHEIGGQ